MRYVQNSDREIGDWLLDDKELSVKLNDFAANAAPMNASIAGHCATCGKCPTCGTHWTVTGLSPIGNANAAAMNTIYYTINGAADPCRDCGK